jgi:polar amino acid transport system substrate-binding protein
MKKLLPLLLFTSFFSSLEAADNLAVAANTWPPYVEKNLPGNGLALQIVSKALQRKGYQVSIHIESWPRTLEGLEVGLFDLIGAIWKTREREKIILFSEPYLLNQIKFIKKKSLHMNYQNLDDLRGYLIGVVNNYAYDETFLNSKKIIKLPQNYIIQNLQKLANGDIDLTLGDQRAIRYEINQYMPRRTEQFDFLAKPLSSRGLRIGVSIQNRNAEKIITDFNQAIKEMRADGSLATIIRDF